MYTLEDEINLLHERFREAAFFDSRGKVVFQSSIPLNCDLAWFEIILHEYHFDWWKHFGGVVFLGKMIFHKHAGHEIAATYLYEVLPVMVNRDEFAIHGKSIRANCLLFIDNAAYAPITHP